MSVETVLKITDEERKAIIKSYDRTHEEIEEDIRSLKEWLKKQPHLPQNEDDTRLRMMLHYNKFSVEKTKQKLDMYYSVKHLVPEFYTDRDLLNPQLSEQMDHALMMPLPNLTPDLCRVYLYKIRKEDSKFNVNLYMKLIFAKFDIRIVHDCSLGEHIILDMKYARLGHIVQLTPVVLKKGYDVLQKAYSDKIKGVHFINLTPVANVLVSITSSILSEKLGNRVYVHKNMNSLKEALSAKVLPNEFGGSAGPLDDIYDEWKKYFKSQNDWLKEIGDKKSDESKRIGKPLDSEMFGTCGSFRKLTVD